MFPPEPILEFEDCTLLSSPLGLLVEVPVDLDDPKPHPLWDLAGVESLLAPSDWEDFLGPDLYWLF